MKQKIKLSGEQYIVLILKGGWGWGRFFKEHKRRNKLKDDDYRIIREIRKIEQKNDIRFFTTGEEVFYVKT